MAEAKVSVRSDLLKIAEDLKAISRAAAETADSLSDATKEVASNVNDQVAVVSGGMDKIRKFGKNLANQLGSDFKGLLSVNAVASGLKLNEQFAGSVKQAVELNDAIRNLAPIFGMTEDRAERFKQKLVKGLAEIGVGSDAAANALQGLSETRVRGDQNLIDYANTASELAGISNQKGQEGAIGKGLAGVVTAQGGNPNDSRAMQNVADDVIRIRNATGKSATEALKTLEDLFTNANSDMKKKLSGGGAVSLTMASLIGGQGSTGFLQRYLGMNPAQRAGAEAQGLGKLVGSNGQLNSGAFQSTMSEAKRRGINGNAEQGLTTMGMSDDEAKAFARLADALQENSPAIEQARKSVVSINDEYRKTMGLGDAFSANINKINGAITEILDRGGIPGINDATNALSGTSKNTAGSAAVVGGSAILSAVLLKSGLVGVGKAAGLGGAEATGAAGSASMLGPAGLAAGVGLAAGQAAQFIGSGGLEDAVHDLLAYLRGKDPVSANAIAVPKSGGTKEVRVTVESKDKSLKAYPRGTRGASQ